MPNINLDLPAIKNNNSYAKLSKTYLKLIVLHYSGATGFFSLRATDPSIQGSLTYMAGRFTSEA